MFDIVRRRQYASWRVMIDSARILDSPFDDSLICLSGAELELLRNLTQYLHRQDTFVATYYANHYLTPDLDAWDAIAAIVAGLEEKLMGCAEIEQTLIDLLAEVRSLVSLETPEPATDYKSVVSTGGGTQYLTFDAVPEGYVQDVWSITGYNGSRQDTYIRTEVYDGSAGRLLTYDTLVPQAVPVGCYEHMQLTEGEYCQVGFFGSVAGDALRALQVATTRKLEAA